VGLLIIFFILAIGFSFLCSVLEAVLLSITPSYVRIKENEDSSIAISLKRFKQDIDRPLSAILTLNTIAHTVGAIGVGAQAAAVFGQRYFDLFGLHVSFEGLIAGFMTLAVLILSEIIPKTLGANNWRALAPFTVRTLRVLNFLLWPFIWISQLITRGLKKEKEKSVLSRTDFLAMTYAVTEEGVIDEDESKIIHNVLQWNDITARQIMTPRTVLVACKEDTTIEDFYKSQQLRYSRIPVYKEKMDDIDGFILKDELLDAIVKGNGDQPVSTIKRKIHIIPETQYIDSVFSSLMERKEHIALVVDEFGGVEGIVTLEDVMETVLGAEIMDETDKVADLQEMAKRKGKRKLEGK
jgi:CBS domain containing-hemolysin-like protein